MEKPSPGKAHTLCQTSATMHNIKLTLSTIQSKIFTSRGKQIMLDRDLAELYRVKTMALNQAVKRNAERFPERLRFQLTKEDVDLISQVVISNGKKIGRAHV